MAQTINNKLASLEVQKYLNTTQEEISKSTQRVSSGLHVNSAKDDAAGLAIAELMNTQVRGMNVSIRNANDGISMTRTADGGLKQVNTLLQRMRELALQSTNGTNTAANRENLNREYAELNNEISRIASTTTFNGENLLANSGDSVDFQVGSNTEAENTVSVDLVGVASLSSNISTVDGSMDSIDEIDAMIASISSSRATFGATESRFDSAIANLRTGAENQSAARARIMDADYAVETANLVRAQISEQASTAMSVQANSMPESVKQLVGSA